MVQECLEMAQTKLTQGGNDYSPLALAYIGDCVYELFIRTYVLSKGNRSVNKMHKASRELVKASSQAKLYFLIQEDLTEEEQVILKRGRNAKSVSRPKNGDMTDYRHATGLEALIGYLYIEGKMERIKELVSKGLEQL